MQKFFCFIENIHVFSLRFAKDPLYLLKTYFSINSQWIILRQFHKKWIFPIVEEKACLEGLTPLLEKLSLLRMSLRHGFGCLSNKGVKDFFFRINTFYFQLETLIKPCRKLLQVSTYRLYEFRIPYLSQVFDPSLNYEEGRNTEINT